MPLKWMRMLIKSPLHLWFSVSYLEVLFLSNWCLSSALQVFQRAEFRVFSFNHIVTWANIVKRNQEKSVQTLKKFICSILSEETKPKPHLGVGSFSQLKGEYCLLQASCCWKNKKLKKKSFETSPQLGDWWRECFNQLCRRGRSQQLLLNLILSD